MSLDASSRVAPGASRHARWVLSAVSWPDAEQGKPHPSTPHSLVSPQGPCGVTAWSVGADSLGKSSGPPVVKVMRMCTSYSLPQASLLRSRCLTGSRATDSKTQNSEKGLRTTPCSREKYGPREAHALNPRASHG